MENERIKAFVELLLEGAGDLGEYRKILDYCSTRVSMNEGIPVILALDNLTEGAPKKFLPPSGDEGMNFSLAASMLVFTHLISQTWEESPYPPACKAMSAVAEKHFRQFPFTEWRELMENAIESKDGER